VARHAVRQASPEVEDVAGDEYEDAHYSATIAPRPLATTAQIRQPQTMLAMHQLTTIPTPLPAISSRDMLRSFAASATLYGRGRVPSSGRRNRGQSLSILPSSQDRRKREAKQAMKLPTILRPKKPQPKRTKAH
jgi:hypothetical protein